MGALVEDVLAPNHADNGEVAIFAIVRSVAGILKRDVAIRVPLGVIAGSARPSQHGDGFRQCDPLPMKSMVAYDDRRRRCVL